MGFKQTKCKVSIKIDSELHRSIKIKAVHLGVTMNHFVESALLKALEK